MIVKVSIRVLIVALGLCALALQANTAPVSDVVPSTKTLILENMGAETPFSEPKSQASSAVDDLYARIHPIVSLTANFKQRISDHEGFALQDSEGVLKLQRPNKLYWETLPPFEQMVITDGGTLWVYDPDLEQVTVHSNAQSMEGPMTLLAESKESLAARFKIDVAGKGDFELFTLEPKNPSGSSGNNFAVLSFEFFKGKLSQIVMLDKLRQKTAISLTAVKLNPEIDSKDFTFVAPDGVDVVLNE